MNTFGTGLARQRDFFATGKTKEYKFRIQQLYKLRNMLKTHESEIYAALKADLNKSPHEVLTTELGFLYMEIDFTLKHLKEWMQRKVVKAPITHKGTRNYIYKEPYGVALVIAPWNYPLQLSLAPVIGAIAAGNCVLLKPSEYAKSTSILLEKMIKACFDSNYFDIVLGDRAVSEDLLTEKFDYIFFTGSTVVGKSVMQAASKFLTPVTLELGGKSPAIVDKNSDIKLAAKRIVWGKFTNAGQTCVAPDFVYVHEDVKHQFIKALGKYIKRFYTKKPLENENYVRIINEKHFTRLNNFLKGEKITYGGKVNSARLMIEPTLMEDITWNDPIMKEEIFGPILPLLTFSTLTEVIEKLQTIDQPLALYYFGKNEHTFETIINSISFGGGCMNDTLYHLANPHLPFGGIGASGMGSYHGKYSFETFTHEKSILNQTNTFDIPLRYPGSKWAHRVVKKIMK